MNSAADIFYTVNDVMLMMDYSRSKAYKILSDLNKELQAKGFMTRRGMVPQRYFNDRFAFTAPTEHPGPSRSSKSSIKEEKK